MRVKTEYTLVTGGSGYFGSLLVRQLRGQGEQVRVFDLNPPDNLSEVEFLPGDIRDPEAVRRAVAGCATVYHCVAQVPLARDRRLFWSVNCDGTRTLLQAAQDAGVRKVIYISSSAVFGIPRQLPITRQTAPAPVEDYGAAKLAGENLCRAFGERGLDVTIVRPRTILGHGRLGIMQLLFEWIVQGRNVYVLGKGANLYQFVHAEDLAEACVLAARRPGFAVYNIGAEKFSTMRATLEGLIEHAATGSKVRGLPCRPTVAAMRLTSLLRLSPLAPYHWLVYGRDVYFDLSDAKRELGWRPRWGGVEMFVQSYEWYRAHRQRLLAEKGRSAHSSAVKEGALKLLRWL
jgi:nucleoside-diphosphate-sugar epimerase